MNAPFVIWIPCWSIALGYANVSQFSNEDLNVWDAKILPFYKAIKAGCAPVVLAVLAQVYRAGKLRDAQ